jgi:hypothetical protein
MHSAVGRLLIHSISIHTDDDRDPLLPCDAPLFHATSRRLKGNHLPLLPGTAWLTLRAHDAVAVAVPGISLPQVGFEETGVKPDLFACNTQKHVLAGSCPKMVE